MVDSLNLGIDFANHPLAIKVLFLLLLILLI